MGYLKKYVAKYYKMFLVAVFFLSVEAVCELLQPAMLSKIVDVGIRNRDLPYVLRTGGLMLGVTGIGAVGAVVRNNLSCRVSQRFGAQLRLDLFGKIQRMPYKSAEQFETASLVTRLTNDVTQMQDFVNGTMRLFVKAPLLCIGSIVMSVLLDLRFSLVLAAVVPAVAAVILLNNRVGYPYFRRVQGALDRLNGVMREFLSGVRVVKAFNRSDYEERRFSGYNEELSRVQAEAMKVTAIFSPAAMAVANLGIVAVLWFGGLSVDGGTIQVGKIIAFINYLTQIANSLTRISMIFTRFVRARASAERIGEVMNRPGAEKPARPAAPEPGGNAGIEFRRVFFSYSGDLEKAALSDVSFRAGPGTVLGLIGTTGSGKTTLVNLILRFYRATEGKVLVGGMDAGSADPARLRGEIAVVPQNNVLFSGSILDNIRWGKRDAGMDEVEKAAETAQIRDFIRSLPEGYGTILGQGGINLSGGQKQRIAIARALVKRPRILILDDCTSAVDVLTEAAIREGIRSDSRGMLCLVIAQRITSVMDADSILVLDAGRIAGSGTHRELLKSCGIYREIYASQFGKEALDRAE